MKTAVFSFSDRPFSYRIFITLTFVFSRLLCTGPIVRINPYELHINEPDIYEEIYAGGNRPRAKSEWDVRGMDKVLSVAFAADYHTHRSRRDSLNPYFNMRRIAQAEDLIKAKVDLLCKRLEQYWKDVRALITGLASKVCKTKPSNIYEGRVDKSDFDPNVSYFQSVSTII